MRRGLLLVAAAAFALAAVAGGVRAAQADRPLRVSPDRLVNPPGVIDANNSPSVAVSPDRPDTFVIAHRVDRPEFSAVLEQTEDGGLTWSRVELPLPDGLTRPYAPDVAFDRDGRLYIAYVHLEGPGNVPAALWVARSDDGGRTIDDPVRVAGRLTFQPRLAVGPEGTVYVTWLQAAEVGLLRLAGKPNPIVIARSNDRAATWSEPVPVSDPARPRVAAASPVVTGDGTVVVLFQDYKGNRRDFEFLEGPTWPEPSALVVSRSIDGGRTFSAGVELESDVLGTRRFLVFLPEFPSIAAGGDQQLYVTWADGRHGDLDVFARGSSDGGATWSAPTRVNGDALGNGASQYLPTVAVADDGTVGVLFFDRRGDPDDVHNEAWLALSDDNGASFDNLRVSTAASDARVGPSAAPSFDVDLGSRLGLEASRSSLVAAWTDTREGTMATGRQDVAASVVSLAESASSTRWALPVALLAFSVASLTVWRRPASHRRDPRSAPQLSLEVAGRGEAEPAGRSQR